MLCLTQELKDALTARGLDSSGLKQALIDRLEAAIASPEKPLEDFEEPVLTDAANTATTTAAAAAEPASADPAPAPAAEAQAAPLAAIAPSIAVLTVRMSTQRA